MASESDESRALRLYFAEGFSRLAALEQVDPVSAALIKAVIFGAPDYALVQERPNVWTTRPLSTIAGHPPAREAGDGE